MVSRPSPSPPSPSAVDSHKQELNEAEEDRLDAEVARAALAEFKASGEKAIPLDEVLAGHGLKRADLSG
jgi:hypothetical protein